MDISLSEKDWLKVRMFRAEKQRAVQTAAIAGEAEAELAELVVWRETGAKPSGEVRIDERGILHMKET